ncbi:hypothetical protein ACP275_06G170800 [Erythranthe tilingii]
MDILPSVKTQYSRIPSLYNPFSSIKSNRNSIFPNNIFHPNRVQRLVLHTSYTESGSVTQPGQDDIRVSVDLVPVSSESDFDRVVAGAQQLDESVVVLWMASWCRKCIYLKPKLEKLAADYYPRIRFYAIDVNNVPHKLVVRAGVTKMPTIQLWKDGNKQAEVIGGHKAYLVVSEIRDMIENENSIL